MVLAVDGVLSENAFDAAGGLRASYVSHGPVPLSNQHPSIRCPRMEGSVIGFATRHGHWA